MYTDNIKKINEKHLVQKNASPSKQKKYLSLKYLPLERNVKQSRCWKDKDDVFDYGERLE